MGNVIHIEICNAYKKGAYNIRIGDIRGSTEHSNIDIPTIIQDIKIAINDLKLKKNGK